jgi:fructosamine-3-kinase
MQARVQVAIQQKLSEHFPVRQHFSLQPVSGGSINEAYQVLFGKQKIFCKINSATRFPHLFLTETNGLAKISLTGAIKVPAVIDLFEFEDHQILLLEWIDIGQRTEIFWKRFGEQLAALHQTTAEYFGLEEDNFMGSVPQSNMQSGNWKEFFIKQRLQPLIDRCTNIGLLSYTHQQRFNRLFAKLHDVFDGNTRPSLLHGDLWSGNLMCNESSQPVLIDPAVYYGHYSMDLAMTTLFGGFHSSFYDAYNYQSPFPPNYIEQWAVCNLYPLLIHLYLFGRSYLPQIEQTLERFSEH